MSVILKSALSPAKWRFALGRNPAVINYTLSVINCVMFCSAKCNALGGVIIAGKKKYGRAWEYSLDMEEINQLSERKGTTQSGKDGPLSLRAFLINFGLVGAIFVVVAFFVPQDPAALGAWVLLPIAFLLVYATITKRTAESVMIATFLALFITWRAKVMVGFCESLFGTITNETNAEILLIVALLGGVIALLEKVGGIESFTRLASKLFKSRRGILGCAFIGTALIALDDYLSILTMGACITPLARRHKISDTMTAFVVGTTSISFSSLIPISVWGIYFAGIISKQDIGAATGLEIFAGAIPFNFFAISMLLMVFLMVFIKFPIIGTLKAAEADPTPPSDVTQSALTSSGGKKAGFFHFLIPVACIVGMSIAFGIIENGTFSVRMVEGLTTTLIVMFVMYLGHGLLSPTEFMNTLLVGIRSMLSPIILMILTLTFVGTVEKLGFVAYTSSYIPVILGGHGWLLPAVIFVGFAAITTCIGSAWAIFALACPIVFPLATAMSVNPVLCVGALCAGVVAGSYLCLYQNDNYVTASATGCTPFDYAFSKLPYGLIGVTIATLGYLAVGWFNLV